MTIGPVEYVIVGFPGNAFTGDIAPPLANLIDNKTIRILDLLFVGKDPGGNVVAFEFDELDALASYRELDGEVGGIINEADIAETAFAGLPAAVCSEERIGELHHAPSLKDQGILTEEEFAAQKAKILGS